MSEVSGVKLLPFVGPVMSDDQIRPRDRGDEQCHVIRGEEFRLIKSLGNVAFVPRFANNYSVRLTRTS